MIQGLEPLLHKALWLWPQQPHYDNLNVYAQFKKDICLDSVPDTFWAALSADQSYQLSINGKFVCRGPARGYQSSWPFDVVDLAPFLKEGTNQIRVRAYFPSENSFFYICKGFPGFIFAAQWDGGVLLSDDSWGSRLETASRRLTKRASSQLFRQEHIDLQKLPTETDAWTKPFTHHPFCEPWPAMEHRGIPMLHETTREDWVVIGRAQKESNADWRDIEDVVALRAAEGLGHERLAPQQGPLLPDSGGESDRFESFLIDFGTVVYGSLELTAKNAGGGECIDMLYAESIDESSLELELELDGWNHVAVGSRVVLKSGPCGHRFYHPYGFRYAVVTLRNAAAPLTLSMKLHTTGYPIERKGSFAHSDKQLESIWEACATTQEVCAHDAFVDTPWREQAQWWGDARYQAENLHWMMGDDRLYARGIRIVGAQRTRCGLTYGLAPSMAHRCVLPDFSLAWVLTIWEHYQQTGSLESFRSQQEGLRDVLRYFRDQYDPQVSLVRNDPRFWVFLDWAPVFRGAYPAILSFLLLQALQTTAKLARLDHDSEWEAELNGWAHDLSKGLASLRDSDGFYHDGREKDGTPTSVLTIHSQLLAVITGLESAPEKEWIEKTILPALRDEPSELVRTNLHWYSEIFELLAQRGYEREVIACIKRIWAPMAEFGTTSERLDHTPGRNSVSHAWSAHPLVHLMKILGGIRQTSPGWETATLNPAYIGDYCNVSVPTPTGPLTVEWIKNETGIDVQCHVPPGTTVIAKLSTDTEPEPLSGGQHEWHLPASKPASDKTGEHDEQRNLLPIGS